MPRVDLTLHVDVKRSPRVAQLEGMMDVPRTDRATAEFHFDVPIETRDWQVGLITGPSGAGKSSVARALFGDAIVEDYEWDSDRAVIDGFEGLGIRDVTAALSSVGFSSPPAWLKPFRVLSNGEKFRANLARALVDAAPLVCIDEFTSVVDRTVAQVGSHAVAKAIRKTPGKRFVAISCHDDIGEWLQPDWVLEPHAGAFTWRELRRRPTIEFELCRASHQAWQWFHHHHYLSADLNRSARCFVALVHGRPAAFVGVIAQPHAARSDLSALTRVVVLPDYQGLGLAQSIADAVAAICKINGRTLGVGTSHPAFQRTLAKSTRWRMTSKPGFAPKRGKTSTVQAAKQSQWRRIAHFQWTGGAHIDRAAARHLWA